MSWYPMFYTTQQDLLSHLKDQRPNSKWVIECIVSLRIHLVMTTYPLGKPLHLPDYIKNNRFVIALDKIKIPQKLTRTISAISVVWLLESLAKRITTVIRKLKNCLINIVNILKSNLKILKVLNWLTFHNSKSIMKPIYLPCF